MNDIYNLNFDKINDITYASEDFVAKELLVDGLKVFPFECHVGDENQRKEYEEDIKLFAIESRDCDFCFKSSLSSHRCTACFTVQYCSTDCQKQDLDFHQTVCATWAKDASRKLPASLLEASHAFC